MGLPVADADAFAVDRSGHARDHGRRPGVDDQVETGNPVPRRPGVQGQAARARGDGLHLLLQALARSQPPARRTAGADRPHPRRSAGDRGREEDGKLDYDAPIEGLRVVDRYTLQIRMSQPNYPGVRDLISFVGAVPREVVEAAGLDIRTRAVGTGPFRLKEWKRGSRLVLERNPAYREAYFPASERKEDADLVRTMKGKRVPMADLVEINIVDEDITRLLLFEQGGLDFVQLRGEIATRLLANGKLKPDYVARGITPDDPAALHAARSPVVRERCRCRASPRYAEPGDWYTYELNHCVLAQLAWNPARRRGRGCRGLHAHSVSREREGRGDRLRDDGGRRPSLRQHSVRNSQDGRPTSRAARARIDAARPRLGPQPTRGSTSCSTTHRATSRSRSCAPPETRRRCVHSSTQLVDFVIRTTQTRACSFLREGTIAPGSSGTTSLIADR